MNNVPTPIHNALKIQYFDFRPVALNCLQCAMIVGVEMSVIAKSYSELYVRKLNLCGEYRFYRHLSMNFVN